MKIIRKQIKRIINTANKNKTEFIDTKNTNDIS